MVGLYFHWEPAGNSDWGPVVAARILVEGEAIEYPKIRVTLLAGDKGFLCVFCPSEGDEYRMTTDDWGFTNQTMMMWTMRIIAASLQEGGPGPIPFELLDSNDISEMIKNLEESLKEEDEENDDPDPD